MGEGVVVLTCSPGNTAVLIASLMSTPNTGEVRKKIMPPRGPRKDCKEGTVKERIKKQIVRGKHDEEGKHDKEGNQNKEREENKEGK